MIRLTALLCVAIFATLYLANADSGAQKPALDATAKVTTASDAAPDLDALQNLPVEPEIVLTSGDRPMVLPLSLPLVQPTKRPAQSTADASKPVWYVQGNAVNVRQGPSTEYSIVGKLARGEATTVLSTEADGWAHILIEGDGIEGYISTDFLSASAP